MDEGRKIDSDVNDPKFAAFYGPAHLRMEDVRHSLLEDWTYVSEPYLDDWLARDGTRRRIVFSNSAVVDSTGEVELIVGCGSGGAQQGIHVE